MAGKADGAQDGLNEALRRKAEAETELLKRQLAPEHQRMDRLKALAGMSGALLAAVALISGIGSVVTWFGDREAARETKAEERLQRGQTLLGGKAPSERVAGLSSLRSFADAEDPRAAQMLLSVANALAVEEDPRVRAAIVAFFDELRAADLPPQTLNPALRALAGANRLAARRYLSWRINPVEQKPPPPLQEGGELDVLAKAIGALLRAGARGNLAGTYLRNLDLSNLDLGPIGFQWADLAGTSFHRSRLSGSNFRNARLTGTDFSFAQLEGTVFSSQAVPTADYDQRNYIAYDLTQSANPASLPFRAPIFRCANLKNADFRNALIFFDPEIEYANPRFHNFEGADLTGADFGNPWLWRIVPPDGRRRGPSAGDEPSYDAVPGGWGFGLRGGGLLSARQVTDRLDLKGPAPDEQFERLTGFFALTVTTRLEGARWQNAKWPRWAVQLMVGNALARPPAKCDG